MQVRGIIGETLTEGVVSIKIAHGEEEAPEFGGCLQIGRMQLEGGQQQVTDPKNATFTLTMSVMGHRLKQLTKLIQDARPHLPSDALGAIFIDIGKSDLYSEKLKELLSNPEYANTPWISTWERDQIGNVVCRTGQRLDGRLLE